MDRKQTRGGTGAGKRRWQSTYSIPDKRSLSGTPKCVEVGITWASRQRFVEVSWG